MPELNNNQDYELIQLDKVSNFDLQFLVKLAILLGAIISINYFLPVFKDQFEAWSEFVVSFISKSTLKLIIAILLLFSSWPLILSLCAYFGMNASLILVRAFAQNGKIKVIQSFLLALGEELAIASKHVIFVPRQSYIKSKNSPRFNALDKGVALIVAGALSVNTAILLKLFVSGDWLNCILSAIVITAFLMSILNKTITSINTNISTIKKELIKQVKESQSPATQVCLFNQTNAHRFKSPEYLSCSITQLFSNILVTGALFLSGICALVVLLLGL